MPAYKQKNGTWLCKYSYKIANGEYKHITKRGFTTKKEALEWEVDSKRKQHGNLDMLLKDFISLYLNYIKPRIKLSSYESKVAILKKHIEPHLGDYRLNDLNPKDVVKWQTLLINEVNKKGEKYSKPYLRLLNNTLNAMMNFAMKYYDLPRNPVQIAGSMGGEQEREMKFWTFDEFSKFCEVIEDKKIHYMAFRILYFLGIREGELLALTAKDFDFERKELTINKTYHRIKKKDYITTPKTKNSNRKVTIPDFLAEEIKRFIGSLNEELDSDKRLFPLGKTGLTRSLIKGAEKAGVKRIRIHDLRHSHISLLIELGYSAPQIAERVGHTSVHITYKYVHLFPNTQQKMASRLDELNKEGMDYE